MSAESLTYRIADLDRRLAHLERAEYIANAGAVGLGAVNAQMFAPDASVNPGVFWHAGRKHLADDAATAFLRIDVSTNCDALLLVKGIYRSNAAPGYASAVEFTLGSLRFYGSSSTGTAFVRLGTADSGTNNGPTGDVALTTNPAISASATGDKYVTLAARADGSGTNHEPYLHYVVEVIVTAGVVTFTEQ